MLLPLKSLILGGATLASLVAAQIDTQLTGTWTTKSRKVFTGPVRASYHSSTLFAGPFAHNQAEQSNTSAILTHLKGFYDPVNEKMFEPPLTGFSYSFTDNGFYEVAYYRASANRMSIVPSSLRLST